MRPLYSWLLAMIAACAIVVPRHAQAAPPVSVAAEEDSPSAQFRLTLGGATARGWTRERTPDDSALREHFVSGGCCAGELALSAGGGDTMFTFLVFGHLLPDAAPDTDDDATGSSWLATRPALIGVGLGVTQYVVPDRMYITTTFQVPWMFIGALIAEFSDDGDEDAFEDDDPDGTRVPAQFAFDMTYGVEVPAGDRLRVGANVGFTAFHVTQPVTGRLRSRAGVSGHAGLTVTTLF